MGATFPLSRLNARPITAPALFALTNGSAPSGSRRAAGGRYPKGLAAAREKPSFSEAVAAVVRFTRCGSSGEGESAAPRCDPRSGEGGSRGLERDVAAKPSCGSRGRELRPMAVGRRTSRASPGSWRGGRTGWGVCVLVTWPWPSRFRRSGPFTFGSEPVAQPRFAGARADLRRIKLVYSYVWGPSFRCGDVPRGKVEIRSCLSL